MLQLTQTNLKLQLDLAKLVQAKGLPMWESDYYIAYNLSHKYKIHFQLFYFEFTRKFNDFKGN